MKKLVAAFVMMVVMSAIFTVAEAAEKNEIQYFDANGNAITVEGLYYNNNGYPMFNGGCYYIDNDGNEVYVGGCRIYFSDSYGNLVPGSYYYDEDGNRVDPPLLRSSNNQYRRGFGGCCGYR